MSGEVELNLKFDGGDTDDNFMMINKHGSLDKKTIGELEQMTLSEIIKAILFEVVVPTRTQTESLSVAWASNSSYGGTKLVDVGRSYPTVSDLTYTYKPEQWNWVSSEGASGTAVSLSVVSSSIWKRSSTNSTSGTITTDWSSLKAQYGANNGYFFVTLNLSEGGYAVDSTGSTTDTNGNYYKAPVAKELNSSSLLKFSASLRSYSNASKFTSSAATAWSNRNDTTMTYNGDSYKSTKSGLLALSGNTTIYLQWPALNEGEHCYIYVPTTHKILSCAGADPTVSNTFNISFTPTKQSQQESITNDYNDTRAYDKYEVELGTGVGIVTMQVVIQVK